MSNTIIVTGGCGYIGSHVARAFRYADHSNRIIVIDRVQHSHTLKDMDGFLRADYASQQALELIELEQPDIIVHCAGTSLVEPSVYDPGEYYENNVAKTVTLLNHIKNFTKKPSILFIYENDFIKQQLNKITSAWTRGQINSFNSTKSIPLQKYYNFLKQSRLINQLKPDTKERLVAFTKNGYLHNT